MEPVSVPFFNIQIYLFYVRFYDVFIKDIHYCPAKTKGALVKSLK